VARDLRLAGDGEDACGDGVGVDDTARASNNRVLRLGDALVGPSVDVYMNSWSCRRPRKVASCGETSSWSPACSWSWPSMLAELSLVNQIVYVYGSKIQGCPELMGGSPDKDFHP
jgi:hypothetical protein